MPMMLTDGTIIGLDEKSSEIPIAETSEQSKKDEQEKENQSE